MPHDEESSDERPVRASTHTPTPAEGRQLRRELRAVLARETDIRARHSDLERKFDRLAQELVGANDRDAGRVGRLEDTVKEQEAKQKAFDTRLAAIGQWQWKTGALIGAIVTVGLLAMQLIGWLTGIGK